MEKEDLRIKKTKQVIKETFIELVEQKGYNNVSVTDITSKANINRNTFYLHYENKDDLIKNIIYESANNLDESLRKFKYLLSVDYEKITEIHLRWGFRKIFKIIEDDVDLYRIVLLDSALRGYLDVVQERLKKFIAGALNVKNPRSNIIFEYAMSGMFGTIKQWIIYMPTSTQEASKVIANLLYQNYLQFSQIN